MLLQKLKLYAIIGAVNLVVIGAMTGFGMYKGFGMGADSVQVKWDQAEAKRTAEIDKKNKALRKTKKETKHASQNMDRTTLITKLCERGELRDFEQFCGH